jgi:cell fate regulator YaaT (PSP1 superfamily)
VYYIDLSFLKDTTLSNCDKVKNLQSRQNIRFKKAVFDTLIQPQPLLSGCMACGAELRAEFPFDERNIIGAQCEGLLGCHFCLLSDSIEDDLEINDYVIVEYDGTHEISKVKEVGEIVKLKRQISGLYGEELPVAIRKASGKDLEQYHKNLDLEIDAEPVFKREVSKYNLNMKLVSIHYQFDRKKLFFFYTSDGRVDFRELAKSLAGIYKTRIELRQIGVRDEAKKIGGLGTCGREYCCKSFLNNFKKITTQLANEQNLISSMSKLSGPCGKLKCCISFEVEQHES